MQYKKRFNAIIEECFSLDEDITSSKVIDHYINRHGNRSLPHVHKVSVILKMSDKLDKCGKSGRTQVYRRKRA